MAEKFNVKFRGETIEVGICWPKDKADQIRARWPDGVIDLDVEAPPNSPASPAERRMLEDMHQRKLYLARNGIEGRPFARPHKPGVSSPRRARNHRNRDARIAARSQR